MDSLITGRLDGKIILRFAHAFATGGGMERILQDLDHALLARNAMTVIRIYIAASPDETKPRTEHIGRGRLVLVPLPLAPDDTRQLASDHEPTGISLKQRFRDLVLYNPLIWSLGGRQFVLRRPIRRQKGQVVGAGACFNELCQKYRIDLCLMHYFGGADADEIIQAARDRSIPVALQNHFANDRFLNLAIRKHVMLADAIAGMNGLDVPRYLQDRFVNLADGIDLACFDRGQTTLPENLPADPILFLPSRIVKPKGQLDVIRAAALLSAKGIRVAVRFAGRIDSPDFLAELKAEAQRAGLAEAVGFLGELNPIQLRGWYAASAALVFPTYHHEGLGRITIEAQAMGLPVVAYATGGVPEGVLDGQTGFLVPTGEIAALAERIEQLLRDAGLRKRMGENGRSFVTRTYSLEALAKRHEEYYTRTIDAFGRHRSDAPAR